MRSPTADMTEPPIHPNTRVILDAWQRMQADPPGHSVGGPRAQAHAHLLNRLFLIEQAELGSWRVCSAGAALAAIFGKELVNTDFLALWTGPDRVMLGAFLDAVRYEGAPGLIRGRGETLTGQRVEIELALLPLSAETARGPWPRMLGLYQALGGEAALCGQPVFRHRLLMLMPPDRLRTGPKLRLVAGNA